MTLLPSFNSDDRTFQMMQDRWSSILNPLLTNPVNQGILLKAIPLASGLNTINHKLGRPLQGYVITGMYGSFAQIYSTASPMPTLTLLLNASGPTILDIYVF